MRSRLLKTTVLLAATGAMWTHLPQVTLRLNINRRLSLKCLFLGHEDWIRRTSDRLYLECFECGRETQGWATGRNPQTDRAGAAVHGELKISEGRVVPGRWPRGALCGRAPWRRVAPGRRFALVKLGRQVISR